VSQPIWKAIANLGDANPINYWGVFVLIDTTGVYTPELHVFEEPLEGTTQYERHVVLLDRCTYINGILSDNKYHPEHPAWWANSPADLTGIAETMDISQEELIRLFTSEDPIERAWAYQMVYDYWGPQDGYPDPFTEEEAAPLFERFFREIEEFEAGQNEDQS